MWLVELEMWMIAAAPAVIGYPMHSVRMLAGGLRIGFWAHGKLSTGIAPVVHNFYTYAG